MHEAQPTFLSEKKQEAWESRGRKNWECSERMEPLQKMTRTQTYCTSHEFRSATRRSTRRDACDAVLVFINGSILQLKAWE